jgi:hypothetical protein
VTAIQPPELRSHGRPYAGTGVRKAFHEARERVRVGDRAVACPAGELVNSGGPRGMVVRCAIEHSLNSEYENPSTLARWCLSAEGCTECPTWRAEKERIWAGQRSPVGEYEGDV